jgi:hypothetical protein
MNELAVNGHHPFSPSKLERIENCPPSWKVCMNWQSPELEDAKRGTLMHRAVYDDSALEDLSDSDREIINGIREEYIIPYKKDGFTHYYEIPVSICDPYGNELTSGWIDCLVIDPTGTVGSLIDFKYGNYEVSEASENIQVKTYCAGIFQKFPKLQRLFAQIVQPVYGMASGEKQSEFTRSDLPEVIGRIEKIIDRAKNADVSDLSQYHCSADNCRYCNKLACRAYGEWMTQNMKLLNVDMEAFDSELKEQAIDFADRLLCAKKAIESVMEEKVSNAKSLILAAGGSPNYRVCDGRVSKKTDWRGLCRELSIGEDKVAEYTTEKQGEPYLMVRMRKQPSKKLLQ